jgi:glucose-6-phosphate isomerase
MHEIMLTALEATKQAYRDDRRPTADIRLDRVDEYTLGQLYQMLMLATVVEGQLIGVNPYGQPGVQAYKRHVKSLLKNRP